MKNKWNSGPRQAGNVKLTLETGPVHLNNEI